jgi:thiamine transporter ThiT
MKLPGWIKIARDWKPRSMASGLLVGTCAGLLGGVLGLIVSLATSRWSLREVPLMVTHAVLYPVAGTAVGFALWRKHRNARGPDSEVDESAEAVEFRRARRRRYLAGGLGMGCAFALISIAADIAWRGWIAFAAPAMAAILFYPYMGVLLGLNLSLEPGEKFSWRGFRFTIGTLMVLIAYLTLCFGVCIEASRIGGNAMLYHQKKLNAMTQAEFFRNLAHQSAAAMRNFGKYADYQGRLSEKYAEAEQRPWEPVPLDPPMP